ncbi:MAG: UDP-glucuronic acid decarboxylase family protein [Planctomycetota bacterium]|jgi:UDP-glucuronate decarboxylase
MRTLVTGGAGLIGSHLCDRLVAAGHEVVCVDNFYSGARESVAHLLDQPGFELLCQDVTAPLEVEVDRIFHLACPASPVHYQRDPVRTVRTNVLGSLHALDLARRTGARVLLASTSEVYGDPAVHPQPETYRGNVNPIGLRACYNEGKRVAETLFFDYHRQHGVAIRVARIFNTYGPRMRPDDGRVVSNFIMQALAGEALTVHGDGHQTRCFTFVSDTVDGLARLMESDLTGPVNLGREEETSMLDLARAILDLTQSSAQVVHTDRPPDDPARRCPDLALAKAELGWSARVALHEGLARTIDDLRRFA